MHAETALGGQMIRHLSLRVFSLLYWGFSGQIGNLFFLLFRRHLPAAAVWISAKPKGMQRTFLHDTQFYFLCIATAAVQALLADDFYGVCLHDKIPPVFVVRPHPRGTGKRGAAFLFSSLEI